MRKYLIERSLPGIGRADAAQLRQAAETSNEALARLAPDVQWAYEVKRGHGVDGRRDGIVVRNVLASYAHLRSTGGASPCSLSSLRFSSITFTLLTSSPLIPIASALCSCHAFTMSG